MAITNLSAYLLNDLKRAKKVDEEVITRSLSKGFLGLVLAGNLVDDVNIVKEAYRGEEVNKTEGLLPIRLANGRLVSAFVLRNLLSVKMVQNARAMMGRSGRLVNRTGRLLNSASVDDQIIVTDNTISLQFRYQFAPYEVFDPNADVVTDGGAMKKALATRARNPRALFHSALKDAAEKILYKGYSIKIAQVGVTNR